MKKEKEGIRFGWISIINHWTNALIFLSVLSLGFFLDYVGDGRALRGPWMEAHKAGGVLLLILALWRVSWRFFQGFPKDVSPMPAWQKLSAKLVHWMLLFAIIAMPLSGILLSLFSERGINFFGLMKISPLPENALISGLASTVHESLAYLVCGALFLHIGAVLKHHLIDRDETLKRMLNAKVVTYQRFEPAPNVKYTQPHVHVVKASAPKAAPPPGTKPQPTKAPVSAITQMSKKVVSTPAAKKARPKVAP